MKTLFDEVRSEQNIFSAWRHVKRSALVSANADIQGMAAEFEHAHQMHLKRIITQLRERRFSFDPVLGVLKDKKKRMAQGKDPRPIAIATLKNRIVQRAILQILQPRVARDLRESDTRFETKEDLRLGKINLVNRSPFGVGGLLYPYGGVRPAIERITKAIDTGARYFYQSDIKAFFTKIPTNRVVDFVQSQTRDDSLKELFSEALAVHLSNAEELCGYADLFPNGGIGVAQGSSLSAFAGNVLLYDLDHELNDMNVTSVRYIDDILIVAREKVALEAAVKHAEACLAGFGFGLYKPTEGSNKAAEGECKDAINFLGCTIQPKRCVPSAQSIDTLKKNISESLSSSKSSIKAAIEKGQLLNAKKSQSSTLETLGKRIYGWQKAFSFCTDIQPFEHLDNYIAGQVSKYQEIVRRQMKNSDLSMQMKILGIPSAQELFVASRRRQ